MKKKLHAYRVYYGRQPGEYLCVPGFTPRNALCRFRQDNPGFTALCAHRI